MIPPPLTVRRVRTRSVEVPMRRPLGTSAARMSRAPFVLVDLETHEGITGRAHAFAYVGAAAPMIRKWVEVAGESIRGDVVDPVAIERKIGNRFRLLGPHGIVAMAMSALDVACWDALATAANVPLARLLDAQLAHIPAYNSNGLSVAAPDTLAAETVALLENGFRAIKLRLGRPDAADDLEAIAMVHTAAPAGIVLMADFNQALSVDTAIERRAGLDGAGLAWIEEPVAADDLLGSARLAKAFATPIQLGENLYGPNAVATAIAHRASDYLMLDLMRIGGVTGWIAAAAQAAAAGIPLSSHLYPEVSVHLLAASPTAHWLEYVDWAEPFLDAGVTFDGGAAIVPSRPGCGVTWDERAVARYATD